MADEDVPYECRLLRLKQLEEIPERCRGQVVIGRSLINQAEQKTGTGQVKDDATLDRGKSSQVTVYRRLFFRSKESLGDAAASLALREVEHEGGVGGAEGAEESAELPVKLFSVHDDSPKGMDGTPG